MKKKKKKFKIEHLPAFFTVACDKFKFIIL